MSRQTSVVARYLRANTPLHLWFLGQKRILSEIIILKHVNVLSVIGVDKYR